MLSSPTPNPLPYSAPGPRHRVPLSPFGGRQGVASSVPERALAWRAAKAGSGFAAFDLPHATASLGAPN